jgi:hypothetical protein
VKREVRGKIHRKDAKNAEKKIEGKARSERFRIYYELDNSTITKKLFNSPIVLDGN